MSSNRALAPGEFPWPKQIEWPEPERRGPFVRVATICEDVIYEQEAGYSPFRLLNRLVVRGNPQFPLTIPTMFFLALEGFGKDVEEGDIHISIASPLGPQVLNEVIDFKPFGPFREFYLRLRLPFPVALPGNHAMAIIYEGRLLTVLRVSIELADLEEQDTSRRILHSQREELEYDRSGNPQLRRTEKFPGVTTETTEPEE